MKNGTDISSIRLVAFDIDGVLTDGRIYVDPEGNEPKSLSLREIDTVYSIHRNGYSIAAITGEDTPMVDYFRDRFPWDHFYRGCKDKVSALKEICEKESITAGEICYIGDGKYDAGAIGFAGLGVCPADACHEAKEAADLVLNGRGGYDCVQELECILLSGRTDKQ